MSAKDWLDFAKVNGLPLVIQSAKSHARLYLELVGFIALLSLVGMLRCSYQNEGADREALREARSVSIRADKAAKLAINDALKSEARAAVLIKKSHYADSLIKDKAKSLSKATDTYRKLRDSMLVRDDLHGKPTDSMQCVISATGNVYKNPDTLIHSVIFAADSVIANAERTIRAHEAKEAIQDSLIASQSLAIVSLHAALNDRSEQIAALNKSIEIEARQIRRARWTGRTEGFLAAGFVSVFLVARR